MGNVNLNFCHDVSYVELDPPRCFPVAARVRIPYAFRVQSAILESS